MAKPTLQNSIKLARIFLKHAYGEEGHNVLQAAQNKGIGAGDAFGRLALEGNKMTDGEIVQDSLLRRAANKVREKSPVAGKVLDGAARIADKGDLLTSPFIPTNAAYHNMATPDGNTPFHSTQDIIRKGKDNTVQGLVNSAERLSNPKKGLRGKLRQWRADAGLTDAAINFGREAGHVHQDYMPHAKRIGEVLKKDDLSKLDRAAHAVAQKSPTEAVKRTLLSGVAHRDIANREFIDGVQGVSKGEIRNATNRGGKMFNAAVSTLVDKGYSPEQAKSMVEGALHHKPSGVGEALGKGKSQLRVLGRHLKSLLRR